MLGAGWLKVLICICPAPVAAGKTALFKTLSYHDDACSQTFKALVDARADLDVVNNGYFIYYFFDRLKIHTTLYAAGMGVLHILASQAQRRHLVEIILKGGANPDIVTSDGRTAVMLAVDLDVVRVLLARGADVHKTDSLGNTALHHKVREFKFEQINYLLDIGCDTSLKNSSQQTALILAQSKPCYRADWEQMQKVIERLQHADS